MRRGLRGLAQALGRDRQRSRAAAHRTDGLRLATALDTSPDFWLDLQRARELYDARKHIAASGTRPRQITEVKEVPHR